MTEPLDVQNDRLSLAVTRLREASEDWAELARKDLALVLLALESTPRTSRDALALCLEVQSLREQVDHAACKQRAAGLREAADVMERSCSKGGVIEVYAVPFLRERADQIEAGQ